MAGSPLLIVGDLPDRIVHHLREERTLIQVADGEAATARLAAEAVDLVLIAAQSSGAGSLGLELRRRWPEQAALYVGRGAPEEPGLPPCVGPDTLLAVVDAARAFPPGLLNRQLEEAVRLGQGLAERGPWAFPQECSVAVRRVFPCCAWSFVSLAPDRLLSLLLEPLPAPDIGRLRERALSPLADPGRDLGLRSVVWGHGGDEAADACATLLGEPIEHGGDLFGSLALAGEEALGAPLYPALLAVTARVLASCLVRAAEPAPEPADLRGLCAALREVRAPADVWVQLCRFELARGRPELCGFACLVEGRELAAGWQGVPEAAGVGGFAAGLAEGLREWRAQEASGADFSADRPALDGALPLECDGELCGLFSVRGPGPDEELRGAVEVCAFVWGKLVRQQRLTMWGERVRELSRMKHEINNALTVIVGNVQLLRLANNTPEDDEVLRHVEESAVDIGALAREMSLLFPRHGADGM